MEKCSCGAVRFAKIEPTGHDWDSANVQGKIIKAIDASGIEVTDVKLWYECKKDSTHITSITNWSLKAVSSNEVPFGDPKDTEDEEGNPA